MVDADQEHTIAMRQGAVAVVDALGFKEARRLHPLKELVASIKSVQAGAAHQASMNGLFGGSRSTIAAFSDSIIIANLTQDDEWHERRRRKVTLADTVYNLSSCAAYMMVKAATAGAPLAYRGCVAAGDVYAADSIFVGQAIDDAAELSTLAAAAVTWLAPSARAVAEADEERSGIAYVSWDMPLRDRGSLGVLVVNPFLHEAIERIESDLDHDALTGIEAALLLPLTKSDRIDVIQKQQNTATFLRLAKAHTIEKFPKMQDDYFDGQREALEDYETERSNDG